MANGINEFLDAAGQATKVFPKLYEDGLQQTVQETGKILARIPRAINAAFSPLDKWVENKLYNVEETKKLLAKKLENVDPDKIVTPEAYVAVPALQAIAYSMNSEELRNLYANLLANSMQVDKKDFLHPCFVEIIKQLSPFDAKVLKLLSEDKDGITDFYPIIRIYRVNDSGTGMIFRQNIPEPTFNISREIFDSFEISIDNLHRLNLISVDYSEGIADKSLYDEITNTQLYNDLISEMKLIKNYPDYNKPYNEPGSIYFSAIGLLFIKICLE